MINAYTFSVLATRHGHFLSLTSPELLGAELLSECTEALVEELGERARWGGAWPGPGHWRASTGCSLRASRTLCSLCSAVSCCWVADTFLYIDRPSSCPFGFFLSWATVDTQQRSEESSQGGHSRSPPLGSPEDLRVCQGHTAHGGPFLVSVLAPSFPTGCLLRPVLVWPPLPAAMKLPLYCKSPP